jgi:ABC-type Fe3+-hydroxamate transport system substrate-binding protein
MRANDSGVKSQSTRVGKVVHPCSVKSFRKAMSTVTDNLGTDVIIIENFNLIVKLGEQHVLQILPLGLKEGVILVDRFS